MTGRPLPRERLPANVAIEALTATAAGDETPALSALLQDAVARGASIGFLPPLAPAEAADYWAGVAKAVRDGGLILLVARDAGDAIVGSAQLSHPAERLYRSVGWRYAGSIPRYARSANGTLDANALYYKLLDSPSAGAGRRRRGRRAR